MKTHDFYGTGGQTVYELHEGDSLRVVNAFPAPACFWMRSLPLRPAIFPAYPVPLGPEVETFVEAGEEYVLTGGEFSWLRVILPTFRVDAPLRSIEYWKKIFALVPGRSDQARQILAELNGYPLKGTRLADHYDSDVEDLANALKAIALSAQEER